MLLGRDSTGDRPAEKDDELGCKKSNRWMPLLDTAALFVFCVFAFRFSLSFALNFASDTELVPLDIAERKQKRKQTDTLTGFDRTRREDARTDSVLGGKEKKKKN